MRLFSFGNIEDSDDDSVSDTAIGTIALCIALLVVGVLSWWVIEVRRGKTPLWEMLKLKRAFERERIVDEIQASVFVKLYLAMSYFESLL